jgi:o-succinylbenzoate synthase
MKLSFEHKVFHFKNPSGTSRGILTEKQAWFLHLTSNDKKGLGECSVIPGLSPDFISKEQYESALNKLIELISAIQWDFLNDVEEFELLHRVKKETDIYQIFESFPSILFGFEMALLNWKTGNTQHFFNNDFTNGKVKIPINGLIWMGETEFMQAQMHEKVEQGFNCIKMKVGAIDFEKEIRLLQELRSNHPSENMILRVDANGAFVESNVRQRLAALAELKVHSIEQPIKPGQIQLMKDLCAENILPIALDEELIGIHSCSRKRTLLQTIQPQYIILKPSLHGGILSCQEWIAIAEELHIGWWMTSALESNVGLNCIAQFTAQYPIDKHHGLGTGSLYTDNIESDLKVANGFISFGV